MTKPHDLQAMAALIIQAQDGRAQLNTFSSSGAKLSMHEAYAVSWLIHEHRLRQGWKPVGRKIGFTNQDMWQLFGVDQPVWAFVYDVTYHDIRATFNCDTSGLVQPKIEPEIVFGMRAAPRLGASAGEVLDCIEWMAHGFEMVQCHYPEWKFTSTDAVCDSSFHGKLFVGDKQTVRASQGDIESRLKTFDVRLYKGDELIEQGRGENVLGSPLLAVASLVDALHREDAPYPLQPGEVITTGTITKAYTVNAGERWRTTFAHDAFAGLTVDFV